MKAIILSCAYYLFAGILIIIPLAFIFCSCIGIRQGFGPGLSDYIIDLPGDYKLYCTSANRVHVGHKSNWLTAQRIPPKIIAIAWDSRYVLAIQQHLVIDGRGNERIDDHKNYWILDTRMNLLFGPLERVDFDKGIHDLNINNDLTLKHPASYAPQSLSE